MWIVIPFVVFVVVCTILTGMSVGVAYILTLLISSIDMGSAITAGAIISVSCVFFVYAFFYMVKQETLERIAVDDYYDDDEDELDVTAVNEIIPSLIKSDFFQPRHSNNTNRTKSAKRRKRKK